MRLISVGNCNSAQTIYGFKIKGCLFFQEELRGKSRSPSAAYLFPISCTICRMKVAFRLQSNGFNRFYIYCNTQQLWPSLSSLVAQWESIKGSTAPKVLFQIFISFCALKKSGVEAASLWKITRFLTRSFTCFKFGRQIAQDQMEIDQI